MKLTGIIFLIIGVLALAYMVFDLFDANGRAELVPFLSQTWAPIISIFTISAGAALLVANKKKYRKNSRKEENVNA